MQASQIECGGCHKLLNVAAGVSLFSCPACGSKQAVPLQMHPPNPPPAPPPPPPASVPPNATGPQGVDESKYQLPCAQCTAILNVPGGIYNFQCPSCRAPLLVDPLKMAEYMSVVRQLASRYTRAEISLLVNSDQFKGLVRVRTTPAQPHQPPRQQQPGPAGPSQAYNMSPQNLPNLAVRPGMGGVGGGAPGATAGRAAAAMGGGIPGMPNMHILQQAAQHHLHQQQQQQHQQQQQQAAMRGGVPGVPPPMPGQPPHQHPDYVQRVHLQLMRQKQELLRQQVQQQQQHLMQHQLQQRRAQAQQAQAQGGPGGVPLPSAYAAPVPPPEPEEEVNEVALEVELEEDGDGESGETFTDYRPSKLSGGRPHPDPVVETASLAAVLPPDPTVKLRLMAEAQRKGLLSSLQLEAVVYACQRHEQILPGNVRAGFFLGDGAGVGKGRTVAAIIKENWLQGRRKAIWLSVGSDLRFDARRDLDDVGAQDIEVHALNKLPYGKLNSKTVGVNEGVLFVTYSSLIAASEKGRSRLQQMVQWCGPDFEGPLMFDECHKAKNLVPDAGGTSTKTGEAVMELQAKLAHARVVYCSATGASEPRNLGYMQRLGLWGAGTNFPNFQVFLTVLEKRGVGLLELVAMDMKARGMYVCRTLSFTGAEFEVVEVPLSPSMKEMYEAATQFWTDLRQAMVRELGLVADHGGWASAGRKAQQKMLWRLFWSSHQRFFRHLCMAAKVPAVVAMAQQALADGKCAVIGLQSTGEARTEEHVSKHGPELDDFVSGPRELLLKLVEEQYPVPEQPRHADADADADGKAATPNGKRRKKDGGEASKPTLEVSTRGRVRKVVSYKGLDLEEELGSESEEEEPAEEEESDAEGEFKLCRLCNNEEEEGDPLLQCRQCSVYTHLRCVVPPLAEPPREESGEIGGWLCVNCDGAAAEAKKQQEEYIAQQWKRYEEAIARRDKLMERIRALDLPGNPLDLIIDELGGPSQVAEMTGRKGTLVREGTGVVYRQRNSKDVTLELVNMHEKDQFMNAKKLVAVISEAASAGISLQADRRCKNKRRRVHITVELPWSADRAIQQFGRTHRSNQASAPQYRLLMTDLGGERRFAATVAKRLESLGALTQGDRRAGPSLSAFNYDSLYGKKALATLYRSVLEQGRQSSPTPVLLPPGCGPEEGGDALQYYASAREALISVGIIRDAVPDQENSRTTRSRASTGVIAEADKQDVGRFLNRLLGLPPDLQASLFDFFQRLFEDHVRKARKEGDFDVGIIDVRARKVEIRGEPEVVFRDASSGAETMLQMLELDRGLPWEDACAALEASRSAETSGKDAGKDSGFYRSKREWLGRHHYLLAIESATTPGTKGPKPFQVFRPSTGAAAAQMLRTELRLKYSNVSVGPSTEKGWQSEYDSSEKQCMHGLKCKQGSSVCTIGRRVQDMAVLSGLIMPVWGAVEKALNKELRLHNRRVRVVRLEAASGEGEDQETRKVVGIQVPATALDAVLHDLKEQQEKQEAQGA